MSFVDQVSSDMDPVELLERRIAALELKVLPADKSIKTTQSVTDMLFQVNTLISTALSCREVIVTILNRMSELNNFLDPHFSENQLDLETKKYFILAIYPEIKKNIASVQKLKSLVPVLNSDNMNNVLTLVPKLQQLTIDSIDMQQECEEVSQSIGDALLKYNDIMYSITETFVKLEEIVTGIELEMLPKTSFE